MRITPITCALNNVPIPKHWKRTLFASILAALLNGPASAAPILITISGTANSIVLTLSGLGDEILSGIDLTVSALFGMTFNGAGNFNGTQSALVAGPFTAAENSPSEWYVGGNTILPDATLASVQADAFQLGIMGVNGDPDAAAIHLSGALYGRNGALLDWDAVYQSTEPGTVALAGLGLIALAAYRRRKRGRISMARAWTPICGRPLRLAVGR